MTDLNTISPVAPGQEIVFIDSRVQDVSALLKNFTPHVRLVFLDAEQDGLEQMAAALEGVTGLTALHVISHGSQGQLNLGNSVVDSAALSRQAQVLAKIGASLSDDGDIMLYGCNVAAGAEGQSFIEALASATGADVAASTNVTGSSVLVVTGCWRVTAVWCRRWACSLRQSSLIGSTCWRPSLFQAVA